MAAAENSGSEALIVMGAQRDFCAGGALEVSPDDSFLPKVNDLIRRFDNVILVQDWHPADHISFAPNAPAERSARAIRSAPLLWPPHCLSGTAGAAFHPGLITDTARLILRKGMQRDCDAWSAFFDCAGRAGGLAGFLREAGVKQLSFCGLATDFGISASAIDAAKLGFSARVALAASQALDIDGSYDRSLKAMRRAGVELGLFI